MTLILRRSLTLGLEFWSKKSREKDESPGDQVGIKIDIQTEEVQSKLLV